MSNEFFGRSGQPSQTSGSGPLWFLDGPPPKRIACSRWIPRYAKRTWQKGQRAKETKYVLPIHAINLHARPLQIRELASRGASDPDPECFSGSGRRVLSFPDISAKSLDADQVRVEVSDRASAMKR